MESIMSKIPIHSAERRLGLTTALAAGAITVAAFSMSNAAIAQNIRGSATGPTSAPGYDHPGQYITLQMLRLPTICTL
jgi:hypothetical protein